MTEGAIRARLIVGAVRARRAAGLRSGLPAPQLGAEPLGERRDDRGPQLSDLRESGAIEQDADVVMFIYREEYYKRRQEPPEGTDKHLEWQRDMDRVYNLAEVIVAKQRHGPTVKVTLHFEGATTKFSNHVKTDHLPDAGP